mmetsp:Transcript_27796/g.90954  ORF Transcript_27796/g.90954 Transcript_27796/m.90954 type:complete len:198 (+) Transcript_27796:46-639(+)
MHWALNPTLHVSSWVGLSEEIFVTLLVFLVAYYLVRQGPPQARAAKRESAVLEANAKKLEQALKEKEERERAKKLFSEHTRGGEAMRIRKGGKYNVAKQVHAFIDSHKLVLVGNSWEHVTTEAKRELTPLVSAEAFGILDMDVHMPGDVVGHCQEAMRIKTKCREPPWCFWKGEFLAGGAQLEALVTQPKKLKAALA